MIESQDTGQITKRLAPFGVPVLEPACPGQTWPASMPSSPSWAGPPGTSPRPDQRWPGCAPGCARSPRQCRTTRNRSPYYYELDQTYYLGHLGHVRRPAAQAARHDRASRTRPGAPPASGGYPQLSAEYILKANPDYVILADTLCCQQDAPTLREAPPGVARAGSAVQAPGTSSLLNDDIASRWGPRVTTLLGTVETAVARDMKR